MPKPAAIIVLSAWGSGSSAVTGYLDKCGGYTCPPHIQTVDARTPNAYEPYEYRGALSAVIDEISLSPCGNPQQFKQFLADWLPKQWQLAVAAGSRKLVLKHPLQAYFLPMLDELADCRYVVVKRRLADIEKTRDRRNWPASFGSQGARSIYEIIQMQLDRIHKPYLMIPFEDFGRDDALRDALVSFAGLSASPEQKAEAEAYLR